MCKTNKTKQKTFRTLVFLWANFCFLLSIEKGNENNIFFYWLWHTNQNFKNLSLFLSLTSYWKTWNWIMLVLIFVNQLRHKKISKDIYFRFSMSQHSLKLLYSTFNAFYFGVLSVLCVWVCVNWLLGFYIFVFMFFSYEWDSSDCWCFICFWLDYIAHVHEFCSFLPFFSVAWDNSLYFFWMHTLFFWIVFNQMKHKFQINIKC